MNAKNPVLGKADLHVHSSYSSDCTSSIEVVLDQAAFRAGLDVIAITDHDNLAGALRAIDMAQDYGIGVIPGCEISTKQGHLLALFVYSPIPRGLSVYESIARVGAQGGICIAAHPMAAYAHSLTASHIDQILADPDLRSVMVGIETLNSGLPYQSSNLLAAQLCQRVGLSPTGSSDSHVSWSIGNGITRFPGTTVDDLRKALVEQTTIAVSQIKKKPVKYWPSFAYHICLRQMGLALWSPAPGASYKLRPLARVNGLN
jgi:predicted metal-dependent phosphoesterase TrpH